MWPATINQADPNVKYVQPPITVIALGKSVYANWTGSEMRPLRGMSLFFHSARDLRPRFRGKFRPRGSILGNFGCEFVFDVGG